MDTAKQEKMERIIADLEKLASELYDAGFKGHSATLYDLAYAVEREVQEDMMYEFFKQSAE